APALERQGWGWKSGFPSPPLPRHHAAAHRPRTAPPTLRLLEVAKRQRRADTAPADALAVERHGIHHVHLESEPRAGRGQDRRRRLAAAREAKVVTDHHDAGAELLRQELRESLGGEVTQGLAEA